MGSLSFAKARNTAPPLAVPEDGITSGERPVSPHERSRPHRIAFTLVIIGVFPMTHHVESVGSESGGGASLMHRPLGWHSGRPSRCAAMPHKFPKYSIKPPLKTACDGKDSGV